MHGRSRICQECWTALSDAQNDAELEYLTARKYSFCCPRCNCDWERDFPGYVCIMQHVVTEGAGTDRWGWLLLVNYDSKSAIVTEFVGTDSLYNSQGGVCFDKLLWQGPTDMLVRITNRVRGNYLLLPNDFQECEVFLRGLQHWGCFLDGIIAWAQLGSPNWSATPLGSPDWSATPRRGQHLGWVRTLDYRSLGTRRPLQAIYQIFITNPKPLQ